MGDWTDTNLISRKTQGEFSHENEPDNRRSLRVCARTLVVGMESLYQDCIRV